jgi:hypothetical protein
VECVTDKEKEKMEEKKKELVFIGGVELIDLDDCNILDRKLQYDSTNSDDDEGPNAAPHPDAVIVKQEASWFQLWVEKR